MSIVQNIAGALRTAFRRYRGQETLESKLQESADITRRTGDTIAKIRTTTQSAIERAEQSLKL